MLQIVEKKKLGDWIMPDAFTREVDLVHRKHEFWIIVFNTHRYGENLERHPFASPDEYFMPK